MKYYLLLIHFLLVVLVCDAQPTIKQWDYRYGGFSSDFISVIQETSDGGFIMGGSSKSANNGDKTTSAFGGLDYWVVKLDANGLKVWDAAFGGDADDALYSLVQTTDGGYIMGGLSRSGISGNKTAPNKGDQDMWVVKIDAAGNYQWDRSYGGDSLDGCSSIKQTTDGGYILGGHSNTNANGDKTEPRRGGAFRTDLWIVKIDAAGNKTWDRTYGGTENESYPELKQTTDGGYIIICDSRSGVGGDKTTVNYGGADIWLLKLDGGGNYMWEQNYGGAQSDYGNDVLQTPDGGYLLGSEANSAISGNKGVGKKGASDYWIIKTDALGVKQWERVFGANQTEEFYKFYPTNDCGYLLIGDSYSLNDTLDKSEPNLGTEQIWIVKMDAAGNKVWDKTLMGTGHDEDGVGVQTKDGCYVFAGSSNSGIGGDKTQPLRDTTGSTLGWYDYWVIKFCDSTTTLTISMSDKTVCPGGCDSLVPVFAAAPCYAPYTYSWTPNGETTSAIKVCPSATTPYTVTITDNTGATLTTTATVTVVAGLTPAITGDTIICAGGNTVLDAGSGFTGYSWSNAATTQTITVNIPGQYIVTVSDAGGCTGSDTVDITLSPGLTPVISGSTSFCIGSSIVLDAGGPYAGYAWSNSATTQTITINTAGVYMVIVTDVNGCTGSDTVTVTVGSSLSPTITGGDSLCSGNTLVLDAGGPYSTYAWSTTGTTQTITVSMGGTYIVTVSDASGCTGTDTVVVTSNPLPTPFISGSSSFCTGSSTVLDAGGPYALYSWSTPQGGAATQTIVVNTAGTYTVTVTDLNGCIGSASKTVTVSSSLTPTISGGSAICNGQPLLLDAGTGYSSYNWSTTDTTQSIVVTTSGTYIVSVSDASGCTGSDSVYVTIRSNPTINAADVTTCQNSSGTLVATGGVSYSWSPNNYLTCDTCNPTSVVNAPLGTLQYIVWGTDSFGCTNIDTVDVTVTVGPTAFVSSDTTIIFGTSIQLFSDGGLNYSWTPSTALDNPASQFPIARPRDTTTYCVIVSLDSSNCADTACMRVNVDYKCGEVFVPTAFSPNGDHDNDVECVMGSSCIVEMEFRIFDRWGEKVFEGTSPEACWNGTYDGKDMNTAVFAYTLKATLITGKVIERKGNISLIR